MMSFFPTYDFFFPPFLPSFLPISFSVADFQFHLRVHKVVDCQRQRNHCRVYMGTSKCKTKHHERCIYRCRLIQTNVKFCVIYCHTLRVAHYNPGKKIQYINFNFCNYPGNLQLLFPRQLRGNCISRWYCTLFNSHVVQDIYLFDM